MSFTKVHTLGACRSIGENPLKILEGYYFLNKSKSWGLCHFIMTSGLLEGA